MIEQTRHGLNKLKSWLRDEHVLLAVLVCLPCYLITAFALYSANFSGYLIAFVLLLLFLLCCFVIVASKQKTDYQARTLTNLVESLIDGDYTLRGKLQTSRAYQELFELINSLADTLSQHKSEARESKMLLERILEQMDAMVLAVDPNSCVVMANASAKQLLPAKSEILGRKLSDSVAGVQILESAAGVIEFQSQELPGEYFLFKETFLSEGVEHQLFLLTNAERLLMEKERQAWQSLLRVLSHEMNNSLAPIASISQTMTKKIDKLADDSVRESLSKGVAIIDERARSLSGFIASYSQLSHLPKAKMVQVDLLQLLSQVTSLFSEVEFDLQGCQPRQFSGDKQQLQQLLINLFKNASEAMSHQQQKRISIYSSESVDSWQLLIADYGNGVANLDNLFVPFYSTKSGGSGIGLALCRQIMFNHQGSIKLDNRVTENGCLVTLSFPLS